MWGGMDDSRALNCLLHPHSPLLQAEPRAGCDPVHLLAVLCYRRGYFKAPFHRLQIPLPLLYFQKKTSVSGSSQQTPASV